MKGKKNVKFGVNEIGIEKNMFKFLQIIGKNRRNKYNPTFR